MIYYIAIRCVCIIPRTIWISQTTISRRSLTCAAILMLNGADPAIKTFSGRQVSSRGDRQTP